MLPPVLRALLLAGLVAPAFFLPGIGAAEAKGGKEKSPPEAGEKAPGDDPGEMFRLTGSGWPEKLRALEPKEETFGSLTVKAWAVPDACPYLLAGVLLECEKNGLGRPRKLSKLREAATRVRSKKGQILIELALSSGEAHCILGSELKKHFFIEQKEKKLSFSVEPMERLPLEPWKIFLYPPGTVRGFERKPLCVFQKAAFRLFVTPAKDGGGDPIKVSLLGVAVQSRGPDGKNSISPGERQLAVRKWEDILVKDAAVTFRPGTWDVPPPPAGFVELISSLDRK